MLEHRLPSSDLLVPQAQEDVTVPTQQRSELEPRTPPAPLVPLELTPGSGQSPSAEAFTQLVEDHQSFITRVVAHRLGSDLFSRFGQDTVQKVLCKVWQRYPSDGSNLRGWLAKTAGNEAIDVCRRENRRRYIDLDAECQNPGVEKAIAQSAYEQSSSSIFDTESELGALMLSVMPGGQTGVGQLSVKMLALAEAGYTGPELAEMFDIPLGTVSSRLGKARDRIRRHRSLFEDYLTD